LQLIRKKAPKAKLILALSTPLQSTSNQNKLNSRIDDRNRIVQELAQKYGATINDLYGISKGHPEYYKDPYHFKPGAIDLQGKRVGETVKKALSQ
jgi:lysophospholipase L1-like esterase